ncbi:DUF397 domain-containing protein [Streptomyces sp. SID12501]
MGNHPEDVSARDSKTPHGSTLIFPPIIWTSFVARVKNGSLTA